MEYSEIKAFLNDTPQYGETTGVERAGKLLELLGNPDKNLKIIHIAGTNGKGSVCSYIDDILKKSGYKTGLFTSPHLVTIRERIFTLLLLPVEDVLVPVPQPATPNTSITRHINKHNLFFIL